MAKDVRTGRPDTPLESGGTWAVARLAHFSQCFPSGQHIRSMMCTNAGQHGGASPPGGIRMELIQIALRNPCHPEEGSLHLAHANGSPLRSITQSSQGGISCTDILHPDISQSDGRGGRFNFSGKTYPDPLIALTRRVFLSVYSVTVFS